MNKLSKSEVEKIAQLARINLSDKEKELYSDQLSEILKFVEKLEEVDTKDVAETSQVTGLENIYRDDVANEKIHIDKDDKINREKLLANAPAQQNGYIKVKQILE